MEILKNVWFEFFVSNTFSFQHTCHFMLTGSLLQTLKFTKKVRRYKFRKLLHNFCWAGNSFEHKMTNMLDIKSVWNKNSSHTFFNISMVDTPKGIFSIISSFLFWRKSKKMVQNQKVALLGRHRKWSPTTVCLASLFLLVEVNLQRNNSSAATQKTVLGSTWKGWGVE